MRPIELLNIPKATKTAINEIPNSWRKINKSYLQHFSKKDIIRLNILATAVGIGCGFAAIGFRALIGLFQNYILHNQWDHHLISPINHVRGWGIFIILPAGLLASKLITHFFAREATGHGVPEVIEAVWANGGRIRKRIVAVKALASSITIASGGSVGREGPIVQIGSAIGSSIGQMLGLKPKLIKTLVGCGAAGAIAATFNTPIAGVIFAIEIIVLELKTKSFVPLVISSVFATIISRLYIGNEPAFFVPEYFLKNPIELVFYLGLGVLSGIVGVIVIKTLYGIEDFVDSIKTQVWVKPIVGGLILASIGHFFPQIYGVGYETISDVLQQNATFTLMAAMVVLKIIAMSVTLSSGGSGGVFAPSLFIGAMLGGSFGYLIHLAFPDLTASYGAYALVGMAALFSATGRATFTAIVILFEMTLDYSIILPLMFVCVTADQVAWAISEESIYSQKLKRKGLKFVTDISANLMSMTLIKDIMTKNIDTLEPNMPIDFVLKNRISHGHTIYPVVNESLHLLGLVSKARLENIDQKCLNEAVESVMEPARAIVSPLDSVAVALAKIEKIRDPRIMVVERHSNKLVGIVSPIDFVRMNHSEE